MGELEKTYRDLTTLVRTSVDGNIDKGKIQAAVEGLVDIFQKEPYNELLLFFYTNSSENYIYGHIANSTILSIAFAVSLGLSREDIVDAGLCAFGHDFGMVEYLELFKKPAQLTSHESRSIQHHPQRSAEIFKPHFPERVVAAILDMHEFVNGKGYPKGKLGAEISPLAKIVSICDIFEALTHARNFRGEFTPYTAIKMIIKKKDIMFDRKVVKKFIEFMSIYPVGNLVRINTGETGMVIASNPRFPTRSIVRVLLNDKNEVKTEEKLVNLSNDPMLYISGPIETKEEKKILNAIKPRGDILLGMSLLWIFLCGMPLARAVDYRDLAIEQRQKDILEKAQAPDPKEMDKALEDEKRIIKDQLSVITGEEDTKYTIVNGDTLQVTYKDQGRDVSGVYQVNPDGEIVLPLIGKTKVSGMNRGEARNSLNTQLAEYIRVPALTVEINAAGKYIVLGAAGPGVFELRPDLSVLEAVINAGYDTRRTNLSTVLVMRGGKEKPEIIKLNLKKMVTKGDRSDDIAVKPGDLIYIPNTFFYDFEAFKNNVFTYITDYYTLGGSTLIQQKQTRNNTN